MLTRRNISTTDDRVNNQLDSMSRGLRSNYIEECILFKLDFDAENYVLKKEVERLIDEKLKTLQPIETTQTTQTPNRNKRKAIKGILDI